MKIASHPIVTMTISSISLALAVIALASPAAAQDTDAEARAAWAEQCEDWDDWDKPAPPFHVFGNTWHVGTCGISAILVTGDDGHVLIDTGTEAGSQVIADNIEALGFRLEDVRYLLSSHEHFDHVGGMSLLRELTGAQVIASPQAAPVLESGEASVEDPQHGMHDPMVPVAVDRVLDGNTVVETGNIRMIAIPTPGHTPGALSWMWRTCESARCEDIVYADSLSPVSSDDYRFSDNSVYVRTYGEGLLRLEMLGGMGCSILLTPHPSASRMRDKLLAGDLTSGMDCAAYAADRLAALEARLAREAEEAAR